MRYLIEYGPDDKRDKWGHTIKAAPVYTMSFDSHIEAEKVAMQISKEHKRWSVHLLDTQGPEDEDLPDTTWLMKSFEGGVCWKNDNYTKALRKSNFKHLKNK